MLFERLNNLEDKLCRAAVFMWLFEGKSYQDIANTLGLDERGKAYRLVQKGLAILRIAIEDHNRGMQP